MRKPINRRGRIGQTTKNITLLVMIWGYTWGSQHLPINQTICGCRIYTIFITFDNYIAFKKQMMKFSISSLNKNLVEDSFFCTVRLNRLVRYSRRFEDTLLLQNGENP